MSDFFGGADFLSELQSSDGIYLKLKDGENKVRILASTTGGAANAVGYKYYRDVPQGSEDSAVVVLRDKPKVLPSDVKTSIFGKREVTPTVFCVVYDYSTASVKVWDCRQKTILEPLIKIARQAADMGNKKPTDFDIVVEKRPGKPVKYTVDAVKAAPLAADVQAVVSLYHIDPEKVFTGGKLFELKSERAPEVAVSVAPAEIPAAATTIADTLRSELMKPNTTERINALREWANDPRQLAAFAALPGGQVPAELVESIFAECGLSTQTDEPVKELVSVGAPSAAGVDESDIPF